ncbi:MAG: homogentisate 1,2-dioxygenase [Kiloniellaceae bacterium]
MKRWISLPRVEGTASRQAHADLPAGTYERELGKEGFYGPATQMYHKHPPTGWIDWDGPLRPRAFDLNRITSLADGPWGAAEVLYNAQVRYRFWQTEGKMETLARNGDGDDLLFVHRGKGAFFCDYGRLEIGEGDYIVVPRGTMWRTEFDGRAAVLMIEATGDSYRLPDRGLAGPHAIFDPAILDTPVIDDAFRAQQTPEGRADTWQVRIKRRNRISTVTYPFNPLDAVGWHGNLAPLRINVRHIRPLMSHRYHLPPSAHTTFLSGRFVVCTFVPRPFETDPGALKVPFFHNNDDYDEVIFYHRGHFFSRDDIAEGMVTFHPCGFTHGPHPKALRGMLRPGKSGTDEVAVMLDTRDALDVGELADGVENLDYVNSWRGGPDTTAAE